MSAAFADRLIARARALGAPLCVGLDPYPARIPGLFGQGLKECALRFQRDRVRLLGQLIAEARNLGLPVILDAKRGDIGATAEGYAQAALGPAPGFDADAVTVSPYMGRDSLEPFLALAQARGKGVAALLRTSNPGAADLQDLDAGGQPLWARTAQLLAPAQARLLGASGWSGLMAVVGATAPEEARRARALLPQALFLVPGYGAQGAGAAAALAGFVRTPHGLEGGVVNASRAVLYPPAAERAPNLAAWRACVAEAMAAAALELRT